MTNGPAKDSLVRYAITKSAAGNLIVDTTKSFREKDWEKPEAFVAVAMRRQDGVLSRHRITDGQ